MFLKILLVIAIVTTLYFIENYIHYIRKNKIIEEINQSLLFWASQYYANLDFDSKNINSFKIYAIDRIRNCNFHDHVRNLHFKVINNNRFDVIFEFKRSEAEFQEIKLKITKTPQ
ncbi:MAG: hypothetical protein ACOCRX_03160 [Candidatus Woesearchaeota archaeon]